MNIFILRAIFFFILVFSRAVAFAVELENQTEEKNCFNSSGQQAIDR